MNDGFSEFRFISRNTFSCLAAFGLTVALLAQAGQVRAAELSESDKFFLTGYEQMRAALVADDLAKANEAARELTDNGMEVPKSETLERARSAFAKASEVAIKIAAGQPGYYVMHCPMLKLDWVQKGKEVSNPYGGKEMVTCGQIKK